MDHSPARLIDVNLGDIDAGGGALGGHDAERDDAHLEEGEDAVGAACREAPARRARLAARHSALMKQLDVVRVIGHCRREDLQLLLLRRRSFRWVSLKNGKNCGGLNWAQGGRG